MKALSPPMRQTARLLLTNKQGGPLAQLCVTPALPTICKTLGAIVIHTVAVIDSHFRLPILLPFVNMMGNPAALAVNFYIMFSMQLYIIIIIERLSAYFSRGLFARIKESLGWSIL